MKKKMLAILMVIACVAFNLDRASTSAQALECTYETKVELICVDGVGLCHCGAAGLVQTLIDGDPECPFMINTLQTASDCCISCGGHPGVVTVVPGPGH